MNENIAIVLAAGKGTRMGGKKRKAFVPLLKRPLLAWTLSVFQSFSRIQEIIVVVAPGDEQECRGKILLPYKISKARIVPGGTERQDSLWNGFAEIKTDCKVVVIHDGARPLVERKILKRALETAESGGAAVVAVPVKDTVKTGDANGVVVKTLERKTLWAAQTPQAYQYDIIKRALEEANKDAFYSTDDSSLVERLGIPVHIVPGAYENIKITTPDDVLFGEAVLRRRLNKKRS